MIWLTKEIVKRALHEDTDAQFTVGCWFYEKRIVESASYWVKRAAQQGHLEAAILLQKLGDFKKRMEN